MRFSASSVKSLRNWKLGCAAMFLSTAAQSQAPTLGIVRGVAYDSLHNRPLRGAMISVDGTSRTTTTDDNGAFQLDSIAPGSYAFTLLHAALDSIGMTAVTTRVNISSSADPIRLGIPSFVTLWSRACGDTPAPAGSGFVFGTVRRVLTDQPVAGARVTASYFDVRRDSTSGLKQRRGFGDVRTSVDGSYALCDVPTDLAIKVVADYDSLSTDVLDLPLNAERVRRRDFLLGTSLKGKSAVTTVRGAVQYRETGGPVWGARVIVNGIPETRTDNRGQFSLSKVPLGTRQIEVLAVGIQPVSVIVDVDSMSSNNILVSLDRVTTLATRDVKAARSIRQVRIDEMELRRERQLGAFFDSTAVRKFPNLRMLYTSYAMPQSRARHCLDRLYVDGVDILKHKDLTLDPFSLVDVQQIAMMEYHVRGITAPVEFKGRPGCDVMIIWTKNGLP